MDDPEWGLVIPVGALEIAISVLVESRQERLPCYQWGKQRGIQVFWRGWPRSLYQDITMIVDQGERLSDEKPMGENG